ncbi:DUF2218 domain-containing protein [Granulosicoccus sp. 3-233]|uniref:DUF2218 domain-containing protein n=1 Tax=Granulosicoccus sp. 3-233 TaxID=3417969 RepID=UPI003D327F62
MNYRSSTRVHAEKAKRYHASLARHFARKVPVDVTEDSAHVQFGMGSCHMSVTGNCMQFECTADSEEALTTVKFIIGSHIIKYGELQTVEVRWQDMND